LPLIILAHLFFSKTFAISKKNKRAKISLRLFFGKIKNLIIFGQILSRHLFSMKTIVSLGTQIRNLREKEEMPLRKLAALLEIDQSTLSKIERDERKANLQIIEQISKIFKVNEKELLINFYSDIVSYEIEEENNFAEILKVAEAKIEYKRSKKNGKI